MRVTVGCDVSALTAFRAYCNVENRYKYDKLISKVDMI